jgi:hypothetical protein
LLDIGWRKLELGQRSGLRASFGFEMSAQLDRHATISVDGRIGNFLTSSSLSLTRLEAA